MPYEENRPLQECGIGCGQPNEEFSPKTQGKCKKRPWKWQKTESFARLPTEKT
jgi:hypothetical protein